MTAEAEKRRVSTQQSELCIRAVRSLYEISHNSLRGTNWLFRTPGASKHLLCHVTNSCAMSPAPLQCHQLIHITSWPGTPQLVKLRVSALGVLPRACRLGWQLGSTDLLPGEQGVGSVLGRIRPR